MTEENIAEQETSPVVEQQDETNLDTGPRETVNLPAGVSSAGELSAEWDERHPGHHHLGHADAEASERREVSPG